MYSPNFSSPILPMFLNVWLLGFSPYSFLQRQFSCCFSFPSWRLWRLSPGMWCIILQITVMKHLYRIAKAALPIMSTFMGWWDWMKMKNCTALSRKHSFLAWVPFDSTRRLWTSIEMGTPVLSPKPGCNRLGFSGARWRRSVRAMLMWNLGGILHRRMRLVESSLMVLATAMGYMAAGSIYIHIILPLKGNQSWDFSDNCR